HVGSRQRGSEGDGMLEIPASAVQAAGFLESHSQKGAGLADGRIQANGCLEIRSGLALFAAIPERCAPVVVRLGKIRLQLERLVQVIERCRQIPLLAQEKAEKIVSFGIGGIAL